MSSVQNRPTTKTPWHLWLVGVMGLLWSLMGVVSFMLTEMKVEAVMSRYPQEQRDYFESFPAWAVAVWAIGVFGGVVGCLSLLFRKRVAFPALLVSFMGAVFSNLGGLFLLGGLKVMRDTGGLGFTAVPIVIGAFLALYAAAMNRKGVLR